LRANYALHAQCFSEIEHLPCWLTACPAHELAGGELRLAARSADYLLKLAHLEHLSNNVAATDKPASHIKLRNRWPVSIFLYAFPQFIGIINIERRVGSIDMIEDLNNLGGKAALRK